MPTSDNITFADSKEQCDINKPANVNFIFDCAFSKKDPKINLVGFCAYKLNDAVHFRLKGDPVDEKETPKKDGQPTDQGTQPTDQKPTDQKPTDQGTQPTDQTKQPTTQGTQPTDQKPTDQKPTDQKPTDQGTQPTDQTKQPTTQGTQPTDQKPTDQKPTTT